MLSPSPLIFLQQAVWCHHWSALVFSSCLCFLVLLESLDAHVHYLWLLLTVLCHHNQCQPPAARMMHAQRCAGAAAVAWPRMYPGTRVPNPNRQWQVPSGPPIGWQTLTPPGLILGSETAPLRLLLFSFKRRRPPAARLAALLRGVTACGLERGLRHAGAAARSKEVWRYFLPFSARKMNYFIRPTDWT